MSEDPGVLWRSQPEEKLLIDVQEFVNRRARELESTTRGEILTGIGAAIFLLAVLAFRFAFALDRLQWVGFGLALVWVLVTLYWFRDRIFGDARSSQDSVAATCLDYYRRQLVRRRDHLRNAWLWHGPLTLACFFFVLTFLGKGRPGYQHLLTLAPFVLLFVIWAAWGVRRRRRQANELQREIDEMGLAVH